MKWSKYLFAAMLTISDLTVECYGCLISPAPGHIPDGVATTPKQQEGYIVASHEVNTLSMT